MPSDRHSQQIIRYGRAQLLPVQRERLLMSSLTRTPEGKRCMSNLAHRHRCGSCSTQHTPARRGKSPRLYFQHTGVCPCSALHTASLFCLQQSPNVFSTQNQPFPSPACSAPSDLPPGAPQLALTGVSSPVRVWLLALGLIPCSDPKQIGSPVPGPGHLCTEHVSEWGSPWEV